MKNTIPFILLMLSFSVFSQTPSYYNDINLNLTSTALKNALATKVISTQTINLSYSPGVWNALKQSDLDPANNANVVLIYGYNDNDGNYVTDKTRSKDANGGSAGTQWNREHVYPKSLGTPNLGTSGSGADVHHLRPADISFNSQRSSKKFIAGSGNAKSIAGGWYPGDQWKGDVARMMMYMYIRYGNQCLPRNVAIGTANLSDNNMIDLLLEWNVEDPVSNFEKQRNTILQGIQGNRNPFIDNPAFATQIWGGPQAENLFGNGEDSTDIEAPNTDLPDDLTGSNKATDLIISEYIEGSSSNKSLEIANFTGTTIDLSKYSLKKASNGGGWSSTLVLNSLLKNGELYIITNSNASSSLKNKAQKTNTGILSFNGNDAIGLFKENVLIDLIGNPNSSAVFAKDKTLQRKSSVISPNKNYTTSEWNILSKDTFNGLGNHLFAGNDSPSNTVTYCSSKGNNANYEYIDNVVIGGISNATSKNEGYADFTSKTANLNYGNNTIVVSAGFASTSYTEFWKVWIDFNQNGIFENNEEIVNGSSASADNLSSNFSIPQSALLGKTRMRVSMKWNSTPNACENFTHGEVEDYSVNIRNNKSRAKNISMTAYQKLGHEAQVFTADFYPNPARNFIKIKMANNKNLNFRISNVLGQEVLKGKINHATINISDLRKGTYILNINDNQKVFTQKFIKK